MSTPQVILRPTVKRDLNLLSVQAWKRGFTVYTEKYLGWKYPVYIYFDGEKACFYHRLEDFTYFKQVITPKLEQEDALFNSLNSLFQENVRKLQLALTGLSLSSLEAIAELISEVYSFYIYVVSDTFVEARPAAWQSRLLSEGILYEADAAMEKLLGDSLGNVSKDPALAHVMSQQEVELLLTGKQLDTSILKERLSGYILWDDTILTGKNFRDFCIEQGLTNPEDELALKNKGWVQGQTAYPGQVSGRVVIVREKADISRLQEGDILVAVMTSVHHLPAMKKAAAIITDEGGVTCHAAIVARELKKPCLTGCKTATKVFKDGDLVKVDTSAGKAEIKEK